MPERLHFPSTQGNRGPIWEALEPRLPNGAIVLEVASGSGEHAAHFASLRPDVVWQPSDLEDRHRESIRSWSAGLENVLGPLALDVSTLDWEVPEVDAVVAINLIHIAPWEAGLGLLRGASACLKPGGFLYLYGAFRRDGSHTAPSNQAFDGSLRAQNPLWGVRDLEVVVEEARRVGLTDSQIVAMPVNNLSVFFFKG